MFNKKRGDRTCESLQDWKCRFGKSEFSRGDSVEIKPRILPWGPSKFRERNEKSEKKKEDQRQGTFLSEDAATISNDRCHGLDN